MGNRTVRDDNRKGTTTYTYDLSNRLLTETTGNAERTTYTYDAKGNVTGKRTENTAGGTNTTIYSYGYSLTGLLETVDKNGTRVQENIYDAENYRAGRKTWDNSASSVEQYVILAGRMIGRTDQTGTKRLVYGNDLEMIGNAIAVTGSHGDVKKLIGASGTTTAEYEYDAFGNLLNTVATINPTAGSFINDILYASEQYDEITETYYLRARMYSPSLGRFLEEDTYLGDGRNLYIYVSNNPVRFVDPSGYCRQSDDHYRSIEGLIKIAQGGILMTGGGIALEGAVTVLSGPAALLVLLIAG